MKWCRLIGFSVTLAAIHLPPGTAEEVPAEAPLQRESARGPDGKTDAAKLRYIGSGAGATVRTVMAKLNDFTSVLDYGADPEGARDSSAAFQAAIDHHAQIHIPAGTFRIENQLVVPGSSVPNKGRRLYGAGFSNTVLQFRPKQPDQSCFVVRAGDCAFYGLQIEGPGNHVKNGSAGIDFFSAEPYKGSKRQTIVEQCCFGKLNRFGIRFGGQWHVSVLNCMFIGIGVPGDSPLPHTGAIVFQQPGILPGWSGSGHVIRDVYASGCPYGVYGDAIWNLQLINFISEYNTYAFYRSAAGSLWTIVTMWIENDAKPPIIRGPIHLVGGRGIDLSDVDITYSSGSLTRVGSDGMSILRSGSTPAVQMNGRDGLILTSPNGGRYRVTVGDDGVLSTTPLEQ